MSKITFREDDDLVERLEALEASKSEAMRDALRTYLDGADCEASADAATASDSVDDVIRERVDELVTERFDELVGRERPRPARDLKVNVTVDGAQTSETSENDVVEAGEAASAERKTREEFDADTREGREKTCDKCGENVGSDTFTARTAARRLPTVCSANAVTNSDPTGHSAPAAAGGPPLPTCSNERKHAETPVYARFAALSYDYRHIYDVSVCGISRVRRSSYRTDGSGRDAL